MKKFLLYTTITLGVLAFIGVAVDQIQTNSIRRHLAYDEFTKGCVKHHGEIMRTKYADYCVKAGTLVSW